MKDGRLGTGQTTHSTGGVISSFLARSINRHKAVPVLSLPKYLRDRSQYKYVLGYHIELKALQRLLI